MIEIKTTWLLLWTLACAAPAAMRVGEASAQEKGVSLVAPPVAGERTKGENLALVEKFWRREPTNGDSKHLRELLNELAVADRCRGLVSPRDRPLERCL